MADTDDMDEEVKERARLLREAQDKAEEAHRKAAEEHEKKIAEIKKEKDPLPRRRGIL